MGLFQVKGQDWCLIGFQVYPPVKICSSLLLLQPEGACKIPQVKIGRLFFKGKKVLFSVKNRKIMTRIQNHMTKIVRILVFAFLMLIPVCGVAQDKIKIACIGNSITEGAIQIYQFQMKLPSYFLLYRINFIFYYFITNPI